MQKTIFLYILICSSFFLPVKAENDTIQVGGIEETDGTEIIEANLDSLLNTWYVQTLLDNNPAVLQDDSTGIEYPDSVYLTRINKINTLIKLPYNKIIRNHIHVYTIKQREKFRVVLGLEDYYFPMIEDIFDSYGIPTELKYMAVIESALNPNAVSRMGATGLWQFMFSTGKMYKLIVNSIVDERRDPIKATHAAARYMKDLYNIYGDWMLVIAAYNCGPGNVNKAIRRSGNKKDYWDIYYRLPRETRGYIPMYVAATYASTYYAEHNLKPIPATFTLATDTIMIHKNIHLVQISDVMKIPFQELKSLNPQYKTGFIPGSSKPFALTLPVNHLGNFIDMTDSIRDYKADVYINKKTIVDPTRTSYYSANISGKTKLIYTVKEGDNLGYIAEWYHVGLSSLRNWNNIYGNRIRIGQKLAIYVNPSQKNYFAKINSMSFAEKQATLGKKIPTNAVKSNHDDIVDGDYIIHIVRNGDTIWDIVKLYDGVTATEVLALNNITDSKKIQVGQRLKIKKKS